jgi:NadR type nicotinamide-nucleotide adenylyltransferase
MEKRSSENNILKIAVIGPESTGKSTLSEQLANHYHTLWVPEYAREYCSTLTHECTLEDEMNMFYGQLASEDAAIESLQSSTSHESRATSHEITHHSKLEARSSKLLICDTTIVTVKIWCEHVFESCPIEVQKVFEERTYDLYLLMDIDLPWMEDPLRDFPHLREYFMQWYIRLMNESNANYKVISGTNEQRFENAVKAIDNFLANSY